VVDDGSTVAPYLDKLDIPITLITHAVNLGQGAALQTGMDHAKKEGAEIVVHFDADGQHNCNDIAKITEPVMSGSADVVIGSRFLKTKQINNASEIPPGKKIVLQVARLIQFVFSGSMLSDSQNGLRAFSKNAYTQIAITENRMTHAIEIIQLLLKNGFKIVEVPVIITYTAYSNKKGQKLINGVFIVLRLIANKALSNIFLFSLLATAIPVAVIFFLIPVKTTLALVPVMIIIYLGNLTWMMLYKKSKEKLLKKTKAIREDALKKAKEFN
jgi:glycosyltransferase involved in cell wall biosynthesis